MVSGPQHDTARRSGSYGYRSLPGAPVSFKRTRVNGSTREAWEIRKGTVGAELPLTPLDPTSVDSVQARTGWTDAWSALVRSADGTRLKLWADDDWDTLLVDEVLSQRALHAMYEVLGGVWMREA